jgi:hypothetical protein
MSEVYSPFSIIRPNIIVHIGNIAACWWTMNDVLPSYILDLILSNWYVRTTTGTLLCVWWHWNMLCASGWSARKSKIFTVCENMFMFSAAKRTIKEGRVHQLHLWNVMVHTHRVNCIKQELKMSLAVWYVNKKRNIMTQKKLQIHAPNEVSSSYLCTWAVDCTPA